MGKEQRELLAELMPEYRIDVCLPEGASSYVFPAVKRKHSAARKSRLPLLFKVPLNADNYANPAQAERAWEQFQNEARRLRYLRDSAPFLVANNSIPHLIKYWKTDTHYTESPPVLLMTRLAGISLRKILPVSSASLADRFRRALYCAALTSPAALLDLADRVESILLQLHDANLLHNDVAPGNIVINLRGGCFCYLFTLICLLQKRSPIASVALVDFGLAVPIVDAEGNPLLYDVVAGTPPYRPLEKRMGAPIAFAHDLEALARILFHLATSNDQIMTDKNRGSLPLPLHQVTDSRIRVRILDLQSGRYSERLRQKVRHERTDYECGRLL